MILSEIDKNGIIAQRAMATKLNVSLGKINYCIKALTEVGYVKLGNFTNSTNKIKYLYLLTPQGIKAKTYLTKKYLRIKLEEYNRLKELL